MLRLQDGGLDPDRDLDLDDLEWDYFQEEFPYWSTGSPSWHLTIEIDPAGLEEKRVAQKSALARYGKQPWVQWDDVDLQELEAAYGGVVDLVRQENALSRANEDR